MKFTEVKPKIKNLGNYKSLKEIKNAGLRVVYNKKDDSYWLIEKEFLKTVIKSPRECKSIMIKPEELKYKIFMCHKSKDELKGTKALKYIEWGEKQKTPQDVFWNKIPSVYGRKLWYDLGCRKYSGFNFNYLINEIGITFVGEVFASDNFHQITTKENIALFMNSSLFWLFQNIFGRKNFGGGLLKIQTFELEQILVMPFKNKFPNSFSQILKSVYDECGIDPKSKISIEEQEPKPLPDRKELDDIVFDALELTDEERKDVYRGVCRLVWNRISKAKSLKKR